MLLSLYHGPVVPIGESGIHLNIANEFANDSNQNGQVNLIGIFLVIISSFTWAIWFIIQVSLVMFFFFLFMNFRKKIYSSEQKSGQNGQQVSGSLFELSFNVDDGNCWMLGIRLYHGAALKWMVIVSSHQGIGKYIWGILLCSMTQIYNYKLLEYIWTNLLLTQLISGSSMFGDRGLHDDVVYR